jgi:hypothetical protein
VPRPTKFTPDLQDRICQLIAAGNTIEVSAQAAGIAERTFHDWMARDRAPFLAFQEAVDKAHAESEAILVSRVAAAARNGSWQASSWLLERRFPERWAKAKRVNDDEAPAAADADPFGELDELARRRAAHS